MNISFPIGENCILDRNPLRIGIRDTFGRNHWAPVKDLKKAHRDYFVLAVPKVRTAGSLIRCTEVKLEAVLGQKNGWRILWLLSGVYRGFLRLFSRPSP